MPVALIRAYGSAGVKVFNKEIDWDSDNITATLHTSSYTLAPDADDYVNDLTNEVANGLGYTTGGKLLTSKTMSYVAANSWAQQWAATTAYNVGEIRRPTTGNNFLYRCAVAGTSGGSAPSWPTVQGQTVTDGSVVWTAAGRGAVMLDAADLSWAGATFTARYIVLSDRTPGTTATQPLIGYGDFGSDQVGGGGTFDVLFDAGGIFVMFVV
jgi:hypothetical protein